MGGRSDRSRWCRVRCRCGRNRVRTVAAVDSYGDVIYGGVHNSHVHGRFPGKLVTNAGGRRHDRALRFKAPVGNRRQWRLHDRG